MSSLRNKSKVLMISPFTNVSGSAIRFWNMAIEFEKLGYDVIYVDRKIKNGSALFTSEKIKYYSCPGTTSLLLDLIISALFNILIFFRHCDCSIYYQLKPAPNNGSIAFLALLLRKKIILDIDDLDFAYFPKGLKYNIYKVVFDTLTKLFPLVTYHTPKLEKYIVNTLKIDTKKTYYLAQGVTESFLSQNIAKEQKIPKSLIYVATLGITSDFEDCIPMLVEICRGDPGVIVHVVGDGERKNYFEEKINKFDLKDKIIFTGRKSHSELPSFIAQHQIGINYMRITPANECRAILKIREYLACGLQVVCNNTGDAELFSNVLYMEDDLSKMQNRITSLLKMPFQLNTKGIDLMEKEYRWNVIMNKFVNRIKGY